MRSRADFLILISKTLSRATTLLACAVFSFPSFAKGAPIDLPKDELTCLATAIYFEARGEPKAGRLVVGQVILNRAARGGYPPTVCGVVYQNSGRRNACQFSFACDGVADKISDPAAFAEIKTEASLLLSCKDDCPASEMATSTHYHAVSVSPHWSTKLRKIGRLGGHVFYENGPA